MKSPGSRERFQGRVAPAPDLRERGAISLRAQAGAENALLRLDVDQSDRPGGELAGGRGGIVEREQAVARSRSSGFSGYRSICNVAASGGGSPTIASTPLLHVERERKGTVVPVRAEFHDYRAVRARHRSLAFGAPFVGLELLRRRARSGSRHQRRDRRQQDGGDGTRLRPDRTDLNDFRSVSAPPPVNGRGQWQGVSGNTRTRPARRRPRSR